MKQGFDSNPQIELLPDGRNAVLLADFHYTAASGLTHTAKKGLVTDGGTIRRIFWRVAGSPFTGRARYAYLIHDQGCKDALKLMDGGYPDTARDMRRFFDLLFREMMEWLGCSRAEITIKYRMVRMGALFLKPNRPKTGAGARDGLSEGTGNKEDAV